MLATAIYYDGRNVYQTNIGGYSKEKAIEAFKAEMAKKYAVWGRLFVTSNGDELSAYKPEAN